MVHVHFLINKLNRETRKNTFMRLSDLKDFKNGHQ